MLSIRRSVTLQCVYSNVISRLEATFCGLFVWIEEGNDFVSRFGEL